MNTFNRCAAQGDLLITKIDELPSNIVPDTTRSAGDNVIVAHSETGHHHVLPASDIDLFHAANDGVINEFVSYIRVKVDTTLRHLRGFDTHEPLDISRGLYRLNRQREYTPEGFRKAAD